MIIGLSGEIGSGKDTIAAYLVKEHNFERKAFADPLKQSIAALFKIPFSEVDKLKNRDVLVGIGEIGEPEYQQWIQYVGIKGLTFREFLQRYGTEAHRDVFGKDFWLDYTLPVQGFYPGRAIVVSDLRFSNEAARVRELGGLVVRVRRRMYEEEEIAAPSVQRQHRSEVIDFDWDYLIDNNDTIRDLYHQIEEMLSHLIDRAHTP
jgi:hypothetical protein